MNVFVYDPFINEEKIKSLGGIKVDNLENSLSKIDMISLHLPLTNETKNLIDINLIKKMKKNCIIINAARGGIINEIDLDRALNENLIFGAGLDVFDIEPPKKDNPLLKNDKVFFKSSYSSFY
jgi:D-3-phosphoglycerate dehydrogenase